MLIALKVLHVTLAAAWFGHKLLIPRDLRRATDPDGDRTGLVARMLVAQRLGIGAGLGTLLTGIGLVFSTTGFRDAQVTIYIGLSAVLVMFIVGGMFASPAWKRIEQSLAGEEATQISADVLTFNRALGIEAMLWVVALSAMLA